MFGACVLGIVSGGVVDVLEYVRVCGSGGSVNEIVVIVGFF